MFCPLFTTGEEEAKQMLVLINQLKPKLNKKDKGIPCNFSSYSMPCMNRLFQNTFVNSIHTATFVNKHFKETEEESKILMLVDNILAA